MAKHFVASTSGPTWSDCSFFHFRHDLTGDVIIKRSNDDQITIPAEHLLQFVAEYIRQEKIRQLTDTSAREILGIASEETP